MSAVDSEARLESYRRLLSLSQVLTSTLDLLELLDLIVNAARDLTRTEATSILLLDAKTGDLYFEAVTGSKSEEIKRVVVPPNSLAGWVVREGRVEIINDVSKDDRFYAQSDVRTGFQTRALIGVPMKVKERVIGVLEAINPADGRPFSEFTGTWVSAGDPAQLDPDTWYLEYTANQVLFHYKVSAAIPEPASAGLVLAGGLLLRTLSRRSRAR